MFFKLLLTIPIIGFGPWIECLIGLEIGRGLLTFDGVLRQIHNSLKN